MLRHQDAPALARTRRQAEPNDGDRFEMEALQSNLPLH